jgi:hypothetical protein
MDGLIRRVIIEEYENDYRIDVHEFETGRSDTHYVDKKVFRYLEKFMALLGE